ncbi:cyclase family protein [Luminiphilus syltensis NOR5-1B]|uniref:Cyclase family protein n=1 Tax=Luminiphilus syltensis NOR5-1B TaxID=565045 RepID=B8KTA8_9GAMM|nr:cyclase family protein [Luminiphilus syltensis]EED35847.1 cyclase family protein [Luminiphilus syltensis NOR5-1B]
MGSNALMELAQGLTSGGIKVVDLSVTLSADTPILELPEEFGWGKSWPFSKEEISRYDDRGPAWYWNNIKCGEHTGTHFDAPIHWVTGKDHEDHATDTLPPDRFVAPAVVIDAVAEATADPDFLMSVDFVKAWEAKHGEIPEGSWVLYRTDWSTREDETFLNHSDDGMHTPGWDPATVTFLAEERNVIGVGVETVGTDSGQASAQDPMFPCHNLMHGANKCGLASLRNLDQLPATGAVLIAAPLKIENGSGSPCRVLALVPAA